ncbi:16S rRNA (guanine(966)-N(2))-methyltransferase RsmD [Aestuariibacter sp. A3R04]|uniref:16S rRNA (guanine(966)-N(2))-methyltransferase RsmD n=1 Tax=Aestuariibacter sp. A3R04 TaxID=2841571 RepID=UPI001C0A346F|nr:16S rRNA (guanine(966)-N(2))-methyltransferase RsmD [Aestuariibacter sp. A3R04]MBU3023895.1 16S rRNA (guanine(966)-N(2))-methyltransferase RsmD [Aestuariibacter sp. A3R04]
MKRVSRKPQAQKAKAGSVRIIAGQWRGRKLPVGNTEGLRPTTDRNKETLFNWLMHELPDARCLDMFAGSGSLGLEALSRYASHCVFMEKDKAVAAQLDKNVLTLKANATVLQGDALKCVTTLSDPFDIVFLDPPFNQGLVAPALTALFSQGLIKSGTVVYVEQENDAPSVANPKLSLLKEKRLALLHYQLFVCTE